MVLKITVGKNGQNELERAFYTLNDYHMIELNSVKARLEKRLNKREPETYSKYKKQHKKRMRYHLKMLKKREKVYEKVMKNIGDSKLETEFLMLESLRLKELKYLESVIEDIIEDQPETFCLYKKQLDKRKRDHLKRIKKIEKVYKKSQKAHSKLKSSKLEKDFNTIESHRLKKLLGKKSRIKKRLAAGEPETFYEYTVQLNKRLEDHLKRIIKTENVYKSIGKKSGKCDNVTCASNKICNPSSGKCVLKTGKIGKKILNEDCKSRSSRKSGKCDNVTCASNKICNPSSGKCVLKTGKIGKKILDGDCKSRSSRKSGKSSKCDNVTCASNKICNPSSGKCVLKTGKIGKKILDGDCPINLVPTRKSKSQNKTKTQNKAKKYKPCKDYQERDLITHRCRNKKNYVRERMPAGTYKSGKSHQIFDPDTNRWINKPDFKRVRSKTTKSHLTYSKKSRIEVKEGDDRECIKRSRLTLNPHQLKVVKYMRDHPSILVVHGTGTGKTLSAVTISQCYLDDNPGCKVVFVGPTSLLSNFKKELKKYGVAQDQIIKKYKFYSFDTFLNITKKRQSNQTRSSIERMRITWPINPIPLKNKLLIVDEAHNMRNPHSSRSRALVKASFNADKTVLLTATPFVNNIRDFIPLINMLHGEYIVGTYKERQNDQVPDYLTKVLTESNLRSFSNLLRDKIDVVSKTNRENFPKRNDIILKIPMTPKYYNRYVELMREQQFEIPMTNLPFGFWNPKTFYHGYRRACQKASYEGDTEYYNAKIQASIPIFKKGKSIIYSNWRDFGVKPISDELKAKKISFRIFTGTTPVRERQDIVDSFNRDEFNVLVITKAGGEGLDLVGVKSVIILDPTWNDAGLQQVIGRAIRYNSHEHLPPKERQVNVYMLVLVAPLNELQPYSTGDQILYHIIEKKIKDEKVLIDILKTESI